MQPYHLVTSSPWPIYVSFDLLLLAINTVFYMNNISIVFGSNTLLFFVSLINLVFGVTLWLRDVITEGSYIGDHTSYVQNGIILGFYLFIVTEVFFFIGAFWSYFHSALVPSIQIGNTWPPIGITGIDPFALPLVNTILLLCSGVSITYGHHYIIGRVRSYSIIGFIVTILFSLIFIYCQYIEYSNSIFTINDSVFGTVFFFITGLHGMHVIIGTLMLSTSLYRIYSYQITNTVHVGVETAIVYWHFVDVVWILVYIFVYWWAWLYYNYINKII